MSRIKEKFEELEKRNEKALIIIHYGRISK